MNLCNWGRGREIGGGARSFLCFFLGESGLGKGVILDHKGQDVKELILHDPQVKQPPRAGR